jgi:hypothetical protein
MTFNEAYNLYMSARDKNVGKPVANNTRIVKVDENTLGVKLHNTVVVQIHNDGTYTLNNGGYLTKTTKDRINEYSPARLYQKKFEEAIHTQAYQYTVSSILRSLPILAPVPANAPVVTVVVKSLNILSQ